MPGYDSSAFWARGGMGHVLTPPDRAQPISQRGAMGDRNGAMALAFGMAAALLRRERTGEGSVVDVSLLATAMWTLSSDVLAALQGGTPRSPQGRDASPNPLVGSFRTSDGRHVQLVFLQGDRYWAGLCELLGRKDLATDPRFTTMASRRENRVACSAELDAEFGQRTFAECKELLSQLDAPWAPVQAVEELLDDPQVTANGYIGTVREDGLEYRLPAVPVQFDERPPPMRRAPEHGEHTEVVLLELGYTWDEVSALKEAGVLP
jgi:crotonobetainyl-CoA:carnitine CoA-transferase CaiB-like acyl-CoA transferase